MPQTDKSGRSGMLGVRPRSRVMLACLLAVIVLVQSCAVMTDASSPSVEDARVHRKRGTPVGGFWNASELGAGALRQAFSPPVTRAAVLGGELPDRFSWNGYFNEANYMTPVKDQEACGSCWAFATVAGMEARYQIERADPNTGVDLSEQYVLSCSAGTCSGWYVSSALDFLMTSGTTDEACDPYRAVNTYCSFGRCYDYLSRIFRVTGWTHIPTDTASIKNQIYANGPVIVWMPMYNDFPWYDPNFWQTSFYAHDPAGGYVGHAVVIVGWDDGVPSATDDDYWIVRNSWGTGGGDVNSGYGGYFYMTQDPSTGFFGIYQEAATISGVNGPVMVTMTKTSTRTSTTSAYGTATTTVTRHTSTATSTSTVHTVTTVTLVLAALTSVVQSIQYLVSILTTTVASYTSTQTSTSTIVVPTTVTVGPSTATTTLEHTQTMVSTGSTTVTAVTTTTVNRYTSTTTSTSTRVIYTTVTTAAASASNSLGYFGFLSLLAIALGHRATGKGSAEPRMRSRMEGRCSKD